MTLSRADILGSVSGDGVWVHCISRCVRRAYLCGSERGKIFDHHKDWIEQRVRLLGSVAARAAAALTQQGRRWFQNRCTLFAPQAAASVA